MTHEQWWMKKFLWAKAFQDKTGCSMEEAKKKADEKFGTTSKKLMLVKQSSEK